MKKILSTLREVFEEIRKDIDVYLAIQRYARISRRAKTDLYENG